ncbi:DUF3014 domain-containing protein [Acidovorax sp. NCPPB 3576]|uniref:DUF3014 domain-containing protein n=1 Tax=Acidovorax sp. NCPPB 3576 TaxID=2940488 RepID=UPI00234A8AF8|nr:DUF3014 domain-containing protein [Acidovorax sp. NCPPB 3576]WCM86521.1 DUF3014 domain-containing protein [Acidovorax sp. NCPPB 3576]
MPERDTVELRPAQQASRAWIPWVLVAGALGAGAAWWFWGRPASDPVALPPVASQPASQAATPPASAASGPQNPMDTVQPPDAKLPTLAESDRPLTEAVTGWVGAESVATLLRMDGFVQRAVATVDNLSRQSAPSRLWPVQPMPQRFLVDGEGGDTETIAATNAGRYRAFVMLAEAIPQDQAVALYARLYPLFQQAYEELGFPRRYFNDRLVATLDNLLQAPEPTGPVQVQLTKVTGEVPSTRPWVRYEFADPKLQALSSGQKILVRMGVENERRMKTVLAELRRRVATGEMARKP